MKFEINLLFFCLTNFKLHKKNQFTEISEKSDFVNKFYKMNKKIKLIAIILFSPIIAFGQTATDQLFKAMQNEKASVEQIKSYIDQGADVNAYSNDKSEWYFGFTPVHVAAANQRVDWIKLLESKGADIYKFTLKDATNNSNASALHIAAYYYFDGSTKVLDYLLSKGLDINAYCGNGYPILSSCLMGRHVKLDIVKYLVEHGVDINKRHKTGKNGCLYWTFANYKRYDVAEYLINKGATTDLKARYFNQNLLAYTFYNGESQFAKLFMEKGLFDIFSDKPIRTFNGYTLGSYFEAAVYYKDYSSVKYMMDKGVMNDINSEKGKLALKTAKLNNDETMISLLKTGYITANLKKWMDLTQNETYKSLEFKNGTKKVQFTAKDLNGNYINSENFKGKVILMNYWATWCGYCIKEMPSMQNLLKTIGKDKLVILAITAEDKDANPDIKYFASSNDYDFIFIHDPNNKIADKYGAGALPGTRLIAPNGFSAAIVQGSKTWDSDMYVKLIEVLYQKDSKSGNKNVQPKPH